MDVKSAFRALVREIVGLPADEGKPPLIDRLAHYRARVDSCASDGSTLDVTPDDTRISAEKNVPLRTGVPGAVATVQPGSIVWLGWDGGDPKKPHCVPTWEQGANVMKLTLTATEINLTGNTKVALSATEVDVTGNTILKLNGGTLGVARQTDPISSATAGPFAVSPQIIQMGSTTVKAG